MKKTRVWSKLKHWQMKALPKMLLMRLLAPFYRLWCSTLRYTEDGRDKPEALVQQNVPLIFSLWHDELFPVMYMRKHWPIATIVSQSKDAEALAILLEKLGLNVVRGSSSKGGLKALLQMSKLIKDAQYNACITVDGPRGPRHQVKEGAVFLAHKTPAHIVPMRIFTSKAKTFKSWDKFQLPLPFSRVHISYANPYPLDFTELNQENVKQACQELEEKLELMQAPKDFYTSRSKYKIYLFFTAILKCFSLRYLHSLGRFLGFCSWNFLPFRKSLAIKTVQTHLRVPEHEAKRIARQSFDENFKSFLEIFYAERLHKSKQLQSVFPHPLLKQLCKEQIPVVVATGHIGSWELLEPYAAAYSSAEDRLVVVREQKDKALDKIMIELRSQSGLTAIGHRDASARVSQCLKNNGFTAFLVDHNCNRKEAIFLPFLGETAAVNVGPALLALRAKAAVYPVFLLRDGLGEHVLHMEEPLYTANLTGSISERVRLVAEFYTNAVEKVVKLYPEQWFWMHQRWKTKPE